MFTVTRRHYNFALWAKTGVKYALLLESQAVLWAKEESCGIDLEGQAHEAWVEALKCLFYWLDAPKF